MDHMTKQEDDDEPMLPTELPDGPDVQGGHTGRGLRLRV